MITIELTYDKVFNEVKRLLEYIGLKDGEYDKIRAIDQDHDQVNYWYLDGVSSAGIILDRVTTKRVDDTDENGKVSFTLNVDNNRKVMLEKVVVRYIASHIVPLWLRLVKPELLQVYSSDKPLLKQELERLAYYREMPR